MQTWEKYSGIGYEGGRNETSDLLLGTHDSLRYGRKGQPNHLKAHWYQKRQSGSWKLVHWNSCQSCIN